MTLKGGGAKIRYGFLSMCRRNQFHAPCHTARLLLACMRSKRKDELQPSAVQSLGLPGAANQEKDSLQGEQELKWLVS